jgi:hypothetical protein
MTITLTHEEAQQVLDALNDVFETENWNSYIDAKKLLRARLSAPEPSASVEPVAWQSRMRPNWEENGWTQWKDCPKEQADNFWKTPRLNDWVYEARALYAAPPQREWQGLTDEEAKKEFEKHNCVISADLAGILSRAIEAKLKEKNT